MHAVLVPGMRLLERFGFARKFQVLFLLFMLPQAFSLWLIGDEYREQFLSINDEQAGGVQLQALDALDVRLMHQRDMAARWKAVDLSRVQTPAAQAAMDNFSAGVAPLRESAEHMSQVFAATGASSGILDHLHSLQAALAKLDTDTQNSLGWWPDGYDLFTAALQQSQQLRTQIATDSTLILTPWLEPFLLSQLATQQAPELAERIGRLASVGQTTVVAGQFSLQSRLQMRDLRSRMGDARDELVASCALLDSKLSPALSSWSTQYKASLQKIDAGLKVLDDGLFAGSVTLTAGQFEATLDSMQAGMNDLRASSLQSLDKRLGQYREAAIRTVTLAAIGVGIMLVLAVYLFVCLQYSIRRSAKGITTLAEALRDGDLRTQVPVHGRDELAVISNALNSAVVQLRGSLQSVDRETGNVGGAVLTLNGEARDSLAAVEAQQAQISQIASATVQMASTAQQVADSCEQATREADQTRGIAERGSRDSEGTTTSIRQLNERLGSTASALGRLHEQTREINQVVDVIRGIAEQTNLLALNAAIEAARAGDQGRGFAVVADEVRSLSQRTQASTQQIVKTVDSLQKTVGEAVTLMQAACGQAETDAESVTALGDRLVEIATAVQRVSSTLGQIASAVEQQAATADEVSENLQQVDQAAGRLLDGARAVHRAADTLNSGSQALSENTARFRLV